MAPSTSLSARPFHMNEWKKGEYIHLSKFDGINRQPMTASRLHGRLEAAACRWHQVHGHPRCIDRELVCNLGVLDTAEISPTSFRIRKKPEGEGHHFADNWQNLSTIQTRDPVLSKPGVRRAMAMALDLDELVAAASNGTGKANAHGVRSDSIYI